MHHKSQQRGSYVVGYRRGGYVGRYGETFPVLHAINMGRPTCYGSWVTEPSTKAGSRCVIKTTDGIR